MNKTSAIPVLLLLAAGCASSSGVDRAEAAAQTMRDLKQALTDAPAQITAVSTSLEALAKEGGDMKAEYQTYCNDVDALIHHRDTLRALRKQVDDSRTEFNAEWEKRLKDIKNEDLKKRAEERRAG